MSREDIDDEDLDIGYGAEDAGLFWKMTIKPDEPTEIDQPAIPGYIVHVTNACYGIKVNNKSRSVVLVNTSENGEDPSGEAPICVLNQGTHENQQLDLLFNESATITVKGKNASAVTLTGYLQPPVSPEDEMDPAMMEDMDEEQIEAMLKAQKRQQMALDDEEDEDEPQLVDEDEDEDESEEDVSPPNKKQKTGKNTSKATKNGSNAKDKKRKEAAKKTPQKEKKDDKKGKKDKTMITMKSGIKFRDMKVGGGKEVRNGSKVRVYYVGQTDDKKVFDKCINGAGFEFKFGAGDVIKGWDMGIKGMKVGGKRKLVIPSRLGYGSSGSPPTIGPDATLTFTIEVKGVN